MLRPSSFVEPFARAVARLRRGGVFARGAMPLLLTIITAFSLAGYLSLFPARFCDFRAFYCVGRVVLAGQDPYREHPLHECEHALPADFLSSLPDRVTVPAPFPGYALVLFSAVARLPFDAAVIVWTAASCAALAAAVVLVARTTGAPPAAAAIVLGFPAAIVPLTIGQPTLFILCALAGAGALLRADRPRFAALAALVTTLDPHAGLAVCAGIFVAVPRARAVLLAGAVALPVLGAAVFGPAREWEYFHDVLPLHALVNVPEFSQFSIANLAFSAGAPRRLALALGDFWYVAALAAGVTAGLRLRARLGGAAPALVPVAFAVFGGAYTHVQQLAFAIPAFLLAAAAARGRGRALLVAATFTAAVPWLLAAPYPYLFGAAALLGIAFARLMGSGRIAFGLGAAAFALLIGLCFAVAGSHIQEHPFSVPAAGPNPLAQVAWGAYVDATSLPAKSWYFAGKLPTLVAFCVMLGALAGIALRGERRVAVCAPAVG